MEHERMGYSDALACLANFYSISTHDVTAYHATRPPRHIEPRPVKPYLPPSFVDPAIFQKSLSGYEGNNLAQWLCCKFGHVVALEAVTAYHIGTAKEGRTTFWQVNMEGKAGSGHVIAYPTDDHHRIKTINPTWVHYLLGLTDEKKFNWVKYWFDEHLLAQYPTRKIAIVESEKTALVASIYLADIDCVWLASCGKDRLNDRDKWKVLQGRAVVLYPDLSPPDEKGRTPFQHWASVAAEMQTCGYDVSVNTFLENHADEFERAQKWDLADFLLRRELTEFRQPNTAHTAPNPPTPHYSEPPVLLPGYRCERYTNRINDQSFEVLINADNYPADGISHTQKPSNSCPSKNKPPPRP